MNGGRLSVLTKLCGAQYAGSFIFTVSSVFFFHSLILFSTVPLCSASFTFRPCLGCSVEISSIISDVEIAPLPNSILTFSRSQSFTDLFPTSSFMAFWILDKSVCLPSKYRRNGAFPTGVNVVGFSLQSSTRLASRSFLQTASMSRSIPIKVAPTLRGRRTVASRAVAS